MYLTNMGKDVLLIRAPYHGTFSRATAQGFFPETQTVNERID